MAVAAAVGCVCVRACVRVHLALVIFLLAGNNSDLVLLPYGAQFSTWLAWSPTDGSLPATGIRPSTFRHDVSGRLRDAASWLPLAEGEASLRNFHVCMYSEGNLIIARMELKHTLTDTSLCKGIKYIS